MEMEDVHRRHAMPGGDPTASIEIMTAEEVSAFLRVPVTTLYQWRHKGYGPRASTVGRHLRYRRRAVEKWFDDQSGDPADR